MAAVVADDGVKAAVLRAFERTEIDIVPEERS